MLKSLISLFIFSLPLFALAQTGAGTPDKTTSKDITLNDPSIVFTRAEVMPKYKYELTVLADSLKAELHKTYKKFDEATFFFTLLVDKSGNLSSIDGSQRPGEDSGMKAPLIAALQTTNGSWIPATQNGYIVRCYKLLIVKLSNKDLIVSDHR